MSLESFNLQTLIHVGVELVVVGSLAFWANRRIVNVENSVADLAKRVVSLEGIIEKQKQILQHQDLLLRQMLGITESQRSPETLQPLHSQTQPLHSQTQPLHSQTQPPQYQNTPHTNSYPLQQSESRPDIPQNNSRVSQRPVQEDPDISSDVLDDIINKELGNIASESPEMEIQMTESPKTPIKKKKTQIVAARKKKTLKVPLNAEL